MFSSCCILHNVLLRYDGFHTIGQYASDWKAYDPETEAARISSAAPAVVVTVKDQEPDEVDPGFHTLREELIEHFHIAHVRGEIKWTKTAEQCRRHGVPIAPPAAGEESGEEGSHE